MAAFVRSMGFVRGRGASAAGRVPRAWDPYAMRAAIAAAALVLAAACAAPPEPPPVPAPNEPLGPAAAAAAADRLKSGYADTIYLGGRVLTVDADDSVAEALAVKDGRIAAVGSEAEVIERQGPETRVVDLEGKALAPGFIDAHGHISMLAGFTSMVNLSSPPVGTAETIADIQQLLREFIERNQLPEGTPVIGYGYDDSLLKENRHPDKFDLDAVSASHPIGLIHVSGHLATTNTATLEMVGITAQTEDPSGGVIRRVEGSREPNGVLEEHAIYALYSAMPQPTPQQAIGQLVAAQHVYASNGFTTAQDGAMGFDYFRLLSAAAQNGALTIDVTGYVTWSDYDKVVEVVGTPPTAYTGGLRVTGAKIVLDGSPQGKTAWLATPYHVVPEGQPDDYAGYPSFSDEVVYDFIARMRKEEVPLLAHANGDQAAEQLITTVERVQQEQGPHDWRPVMIHAQALRHDQIARLPAIGMIPSFFVAHTFYWGDWHRDSVFGPERGAKISSLNTALENGVTFTIHNDAPVVPPKGAFLLWTAVNRMTRSGQVLGPDERITPAQALRAITIDAAYQAFEEDDKGSLEVGKLADMVILSHDPSEMEPYAIKGMGIVETIKAGRTIYPRK